MIHSRPPSQALPVASCVLVLLLAQPIKAVPGPDLQWALANDEEMSWEDASAACAALEAEGHRDWRLPSVEELLFEQEGMPVGFATSLENREVDAWACNVPTQQAATADVRHTEQVRREQGEIERLRSEELELERQLCELESGGDCGPPGSTTPGPSRWQLRLSTGRPSKTHRYHGHAFCVRGGFSDCEADPDRQILCIQTLERSGRHEVAARADVPIEAKLADGSSVELGRSDESGDLCVRRTEVGEDPLVLACDGTACAAFAPARQLGSATLLLDPPARSHRGRKGRLCVSLRTPYGGPICGAQVSGVHADGRFVEIGETGPRGKECLRRKLLDDIAFVVACSRECRAIPRDLFDSPGDFVLTLEHHFPECHQPQRSACPCTTYVH